MTFTYDLSTDVGKVRLLIGDRNEAAYLFTDDEISAFLTLEAGPDATVYPRLAAAQALDVIATNQVLLLKSIQIMDLKIDGPAMARALRSQAKALRDAENSEAAFDVGDWVVDIFTERDIWYNQAIRTGG